MAQWVNRLQNNIFVNPPPLLLLLEPGLHLAQPGLFSKNGRPISDPYFTTGVTDLAIAAAHTHTHTGSIAIACFIELSC